MNAPDLTIGIVSCNRLFYLRALIESIRECLPVERLDCLVVDNASIEPGLPEYLRSLDFARTVIRPTRSPSTEAAEALNTILDEARASRVLLLTDDVQFIVKGSRWLDAVIELTDEHAWLGSIMPIALRRVTLRKYFESALAHRLFPARAPKRLSASNGVGITCFERRELGITHSALGVTSLAVWRRLGHFRTGGARQTLQDAGGGAEADVVRRYREAGLTLRKALLQQPVLAEIITDPHGTQARVRGNRRYGTYFAPPEGTSYYRIRRDSEPLALRNNIAVPFEDAVEPLGFALPLDAHGNRLKNPFAAGGSFAWIHPAVAGTDIN
jgi:glycosyltransferase involved in cell wall biosynthesis